MDLVAWWYGRNLGGVTFAKETLIENFLENAAKGQLVVLLKCIAEEIMDCFFEGTI